MFFESNRLNKILLRQFSRAKAVIQPELLVFCDALRLFERSLQEGLVFQKGVGDQQQGTPGRQFLRRLEDQLFTGAIQRLETGMKRRIGHYVLQRSGNIREHV